MVEPVWLIKDGKRELGPYTAAQMRAIAAHGGIAPETRVCKIGMPGTVPARRVQGLLEDEFSAPADVRTPVPTASDNPFQGEEGGGVEVVSDHAVFVGFLPRAVAFLVDGLLLGLAFTGVAVFEISQHSGYRFIDFYIDLVLYFLILPAVLYWPVLEALFAATPGKYLVGIQVVGRDGRPAPWWRAVLRNLVRWTAMIPVIFFVLDHLVILFNPGRQSVHDMLAATWCINLRRGGRIMELEDGPGGRAS